MAFCAWLLLLGISVSKVRSRFLFVAECFTVRTDHAVFTPSAVGAHVGCLRFLAVVNNAAVTFMGRFLCELMFSMLLGGVDLGVETLGHMESCV